ncbi:AEC family transporter [Neisseria leonii]|uniref:AEC family transporter n=1 Tax=Neisseria leonii TaxID=2995413 RepID=UPI00237C4851|nr:AEC family transporter [Neisseria sp. 3986]MDD9326597.1 AEC family transporter [Neisseria sp. 3986]
MLAIFQITAPVFAILLLGFAAVRAGWFAFDELRGAAKLVMRVGLPALIFQAVATKPLAEAFDTAYLAGYGGGTAAAFVFGWAAGRFARRQDGAAAALSGFGMSMSNTGFIGYPLLATAIGTPAGQYMAMNALLENLIALPLFYIVADASGGSGKSRWQTLRDVAGNLLRNPMIAAIPVSLVFAAGWLPVPAVADKVTAMLASASAPVALFVIGGSLAGLKLRGSLPDIALISIGKLVVFPLTVSAGLWLAGAARDVIWIGALLAGVPMASIFPLVCAQYGYEKRGSAAMLLTVVLSFFSISLLMWWGGFAR